MPTDLEKLLTIEDLAELLGRSVNTIRHDVTRAPHRLPPPVRLPDSRLVRWQPKVVAVWIEGHQPDLPPKPRRGRPRNR
jgi:predicted DNA-binding transcriptional regulator AlpA